MPVCVNLWYISQRLDYGKQQAGSGIRVIANFETRSRQKSTKCTRWFVTFNDSECPNPSSLEHVAHGGNKLKYSMAASSKFVMKTFITSNNNLHVLDRFCCEFRQTL